MAFAGNTTRQLAWIGAALALSLSAPRPAAAGDDAAGPPRNVVIFGDSLTAGYQLDPENAFPALLQEKIDAAGLPYHVVNAGVSGDTTASGARRIDWVLRQPIAVLVLALGGNDGLRGVPPEETERNLAAIIEKVRKRQPDARIILAGMEAPPNMGSRFTDAFHAIYPRLAERYDLPLIPFLLADVAAIPELNLPDGIHPNVEGQKIVAKNVWAVLEPVLTGHGSS